MKLKPVDKRLKSRMLAKMGDRVDRMLQNKPTSTADARERLMMKIWFQIGVLILLQKKGTF